MGSFQNFMSHMDWWGLLTMLIGVAAALLCITFHELSHGFVAYRLGDPTAKTMGRLTLNPIKHIDPVGLLMMIFIKVGWAKPVPVDMRYFKHPKRDMAITALAGPISNFLMALAAIFICSLLYHFAPTLNYAVLLLLCFFANVALLSAGLGFFNLFPISPLDGSKVLFALLPDKAYYTILRYEKYVMGLVIVLAFLGVFTPVLSFFVNHLLTAFCRVTQFPVWILAASLDLNQLVRFR